MNYLDQLNPPQAQAVANTEGPMLIFAGAGSGKTRVLTYRIAHMLASGIDPYHILAITFTNKAAKEMKERVNAISPLAEQVWVSTFHAACTRILRREIEHIGYQRAFTIYDTLDTTRLIKDCIKALNLDDTAYKHRNVMAEISDQKNKLITPHQYQQNVAGDYRKDNYALIYIMYQERLKQMNALDFDDIIFKTVELFENHPDVLYRYQNRFRYVMVDEYQDTNHAQYKLVGQLSGYANNLCVVGDDDQSIYGWRGANIENILQFETDHPTATVIKLEENYRSTKNIIGAAKDVITNNYHRANKEIWTSNDPGSPVLTHTAHNQTAEGDFVANTINRYVKNGEAKYSDFAVLYRTNAMSRAVEDALVRAGTPYRMYGGVRFYEHMEIKDLLAYLKAINNPSDDMAFLRIINVPKRAIGAASLDKLQTYAAENRLTLYQAMLDAHNIKSLGSKITPIQNFGLMMQGFVQFAQDNDVGALVKKIIQLTQYMEYLSDKTEAGEERINNVLELIANANTFSKESDDISLGKFLEDVALVADIDNYQETANAVSLMTMHSSKGLEFKVVFIIGMEENVFPSPRSMAAEESYDDYAEMEEERRLCYVGITRAKARLYLVNADKRMRFDQIARNQPSRFLDEINPKRLSQVNRYGERSATVPSSHIKTGGITSYKYVTRDTARDVERAVKPKTEIPTNATITFGVGDTVISKMVKYGPAKVLEIRPSGADYELTLEFEKGGVKKYMANLSRFVKMG